MANIGATTAFYKVETSLTRANNEVSKSMERLATGKQNANAGDRSSYVAMADTFRLDYVGTKAGIKSSAVAMGYLETGMRVIDAGSALLSRLQELAVLGANNTNTVADNEAINLEAEAIADEFNRLMSSSTYKGRDIFSDQAGDQEIAMGGRAQEMSFGIGRVDYSSLYNSTAVTVVGDPNAGESFNLANLPSDATSAKAYGGAASTPDAAAGAISLTAGKKYVVRGITDSTTHEVDLNSSTASDTSKAIGTAMASDLSISTNRGRSLAAATDNLSNTSVISVTNTTSVAQGTANAEIRSLNAVANADGEALAVDTIGAAVSNRRAGVYTVTAAQLTGDSATNIKTGTDNNTDAADATFEITIDDTGAASVVIVDGGSGFANNDVISVPDARLGTGGAAALTFAIDGVTAKTNRTQDEYIIDSSQYTYSGTGASGTGATFSVTIDGSGDATVSVINKGSGYAGGAAETFTIDGSVFGTDASDLSFTINVVEDAKVPATFAEVRTGDSAFQSGESYVIQSLGSSNSTGNIALADSDALIISRAFTNEDGSQITSNLTVGQTITLASVGDTIGTATVTQEEIDAANALIEGMTFTRPTETLTTKIEAIQALFNKARVQAGSQYAAMESAVSYTTDLTAQYELGFNTVNDVNFSAETAHLAKNQILQQAATAMLAQANSGQQGLLQLIQG